MKKIFLSSVIFLGLFGHAQTVDEIIQKYTKAVGGLDKFKAIKTATQQGKIVQVGMNMPFSSSIIQGSAIKLAIQANDKKVISCYKDGKGWTINPFTGSSAATDMQAGELAEMKKSTFLYDELMNYKNNGSKAVLEGEEDVEGAKTYKIKLTGADKNITYYFIMKEDFMLLKTSVTQKVGTEEKTMDTFYSDYKEINGMKFAHRTQQMMSGAEIMATIIDKFELDKPVNNKIFTRGSTE